MGLLLRTLEKVERAQPVVLLGLVRVRSKPPMKPPHGISAALSRSPMFLPCISIVLVLLEQGSLAGSVSPMRVGPPWPSEIDEEVPMTFVTPLFWPEITAIAPGVDGP